MDTTIEVLKWIAIGIAAGFVGYFGRYLAMLIIGKMHKGQPQESATRAPPKEAPATQDIKLEESRLKVDKKKVKAEAKRAKKAQKN
ncbi:MAG: hypothetical protein V1932_00010 [Chloroflexota bacterium]